MSITTLLGIILGFTLIIGSIYVGPAPGKFISFPGMFIILGGVSASILISFPFSDVYKAIISGIKAFSSKRVKPSDVVTTMVKIAEINRREGFIALERIHTDNHILKKATQLIADNIDHTLIHDTVSIEIASLQRRHKISITIFQKLGILSPVFGMIGTLIGLVQMLATMEDPSSISKGMATAILTTFYGSIAANLIFLPIADKLKTRLLQEELILFIIFEGAKSVLENKHPKLVYEKLSSFLPQQERNNV